ncbi:MAG: transglutaminase family protein [Verrucomicrobiota bacterium]
MSLSSRPSRTRFRISSYLEYDVEYKSTLLVNVHALKSPDQKIISEDFSITPEIPFAEMLTKPKLNRIYRLETGNVPQLSISYEATVETVHRRHSYQDIRQTSLVKIPAEVTPYLFPSRYCQSDKLGRFAMKKFGRYRNTFSQVQAISNWIYETIEYLPGTTTPQTSAYDTITEQAGVCRDFAHLGIALCRALSIPARYFVGYSYLLNPQDFHACFEAYIGERWLIFDPTRMAPVNGLVAIAHGHDAADAATTTIFGSAQLTYMQVDCQCVKNHFKPFYRSSRTGISFSQ